MDILMLLPCLLKVLHLRDDTLASEVKSHIQSHTGLFTKAELLRTGNFLSNITTMFCSAFSYNSDDGGGDGGDDDGEDDGGGGGDDDDGEDVVKMVVVVI